MATMLDPRVADALRSQLPGLTDGLFDALKDQALAYIKTSVVPRLIGAGLRSPVRRLGVVSRAPACLRG